MTSANFRHHHHVTPSLPSQALWWSLSFTIGESKFSDDLRQGHTQGAELSSALDGME